VRLGQDLPKVRNGEWIRYIVEIRGDEATFTIGDSGRQTVKHPSFASPKTNLSLSFHFGTMDVRGLTVRSL
jgi:hypothetical protein